MTVECDQSGRVAPAQGVCDTELPRRVKEEAAIAAIEHGHNHNNLTRDWMGLPRCARRSAKAERITNTVAGETRETRCWDLRRTGTSTRSAWPCSLRQRDHPVRAVFTDIPEPMLLFADKSRLPQTMGNADVSGCGCLRAAINPKTSRDLSTAHESGRHGVYHYLMRRSWRRSRDAWMEHDLFGCG